VDRVKRAAVELLASSPASLILQNANLVRNAIACDNMTSATRVSLVSVLTVHICVMEQMQAALLLKDFFGAYIAELTNRDGIVIMTGLIKACESDGKHKVRLLPFILVLD